jgi:hypothetical protein
VAKKEIHIPRYYQGRKRGWTGPLCGVIVIAENKRSAKKPLTNPRGSAMSYIILRNIDS